MSSTVVVLVVIVVIKHHSLNDVKLRTVCAVHNRFVSFHYDVSRDSLRWVCNMYINARGGGSGIETFLQTSSVRLTSPALSEAYDDGTE